MTAWAGGKGSEARAVDRQRFNDNWDKIWGKKTMDKDQILEVLYNNIATVTFTKLDGTVRVLKGTLQEEFLPVKETDDSGVDVETITEAQIRGGTNENTVVVWDIDNLAYRSFRVDSVTSVEISN